jgi:hypothetical protein
LRTFPSWSRRSRPARRSAPAKRGHHWATRFAPQSGEIDRGAQFEDACFLAAGGVDGLQEARFRPRPIRLRPFERDVAIDPMQVGEPEPLPRLLDKGESFLERCAGACRIARREGSLGKARQDQRVTPVRT